jgi:hypothetical protein
MSDKPVVQKLLLKPGMRAALLDAPPAYAQALESQLPSGVSLARELDDSQFDFIHAFATQREELLRNGPAWRRALKPGGLLWVSYPKGGSRAVQTDLNRDVVRLTVQQVGLDTVSQVAIDETWSALRLKPA